MLTKVLTKCFKLPNNVTKTLQNVLAPLVVRKSSRHFNPIDTIRVDWVMVYGLWLMAYDPMGKRKREASVVLFLLSYRSVSWITHFSEIADQLYAESWRTLYCGNNRGLLEGTIKGVNMLLFSTLSALYYPGILVLLKEFSFCISRPVFCGSHNNWFIFLIFSWKSGNTDKHICVHILSTEMENCCVSRFHKNKNFRKWFL